jgi:predicted NBD/HSP70 family sugar kinase
VIRFAPQLGWVESAFAAALSQETGLPVYLGNDASLGCIAEARFGAAKGINDAVFLFAGSGGIGGGVISDGRTVNGAAGYAGELGHIRISSSKQVDYSGFPGTLEALVRRNDLLDMFKLYVATDEELDAEIRSTESTKAKRLIEDQIDSLADGISTLVNIFNPEVVVLGGFLTSLFDFAPEHLITQMKQGSLAAASERVVVRKGALGSNLLVLGAAELPFEALINAPSSFSLTDA